MVPAGRSRSCDCGLIHFTMQCTEWMATWQGNMLSNTDSLTEYGLALVGEYQTRKVLERGGRHLKKYGSFVNTQMIYTEICKHVEKAGLRTEYILLLCKYCNVSKTIMRNLSTQIRPKVVFQTSNSNIHCSNRTASTTFATYMNVVLPKCKDWVQTSWPYACVKSISTLCTCIKK